MRVHVFWLVDQKLNRNNPKKKTLTMAVMVQKVYSVTVL